MAGVVLCFLSFLWFVEVLSAGQFVNLVKFGSLVSYLGVYTNACVGILSLRPTLFQLGSVHEIFLVPSSDDLWRVVLSAQPTKQPHVWMPRFSGIQIMYQSFFFKESVFSTFFKIFWRKGNSNIHWSDCKVDLLAVGCIAGDSLCRWSNEAAKFSSDQWEQSAATQWGVPDVPGSLEIEDAQSWLRRCRGYRPDTAWSMGSDRSIGVGKSDAAWYSNVLHVGRAHAWANTKRGKLVERHGHKCCGSCSFSEIGSLQRILS